VPQVTVSRSIAAPADRVWAVFTDISAAPDNLSAVDAIELLTPGPFAEQLRWKETRRIYGRTATEEMWVSALDAGRAYTVSAGATGTKYQSHFEFVPTGDASTTVHFTFSGESHGVARVISAVMWPLFKRKLAKELSRDLDDLAKVCEQPPA
jgi:uncharacterized membrane protein